ncbi:MAG TPA: TspO/MBR family protein [Methyloceanibacter sp.]|nr:TspO/MBR family protein [Methyloceanibacter sp.]
MAVSVETRRNLIALFAALAICFAASVIGGLLTRPNLAWYETLERPGFAPPNGVFSVVWTILYAMMAIAAWQFWRADGSDEDRKLGLVAFGIQLALNVAWSFAFFGLRSPGAGLVVILLLLVAITVTIVLFDRLSRSASLLLVPYLLWVCFAAALNFAFWFLNS